VLIGIPVQEKSLIAILKAERSQEVEKVLFRQSDFSVPQGTKRHIDIDFRKKEYIVVAKFLSLKNSLKNSLTISLKSPLKNFLENSD
jgi:hypothetical protein